MTNEDYSGLSSPPFSTLLTNTVGIKEFHDFVPHTHLDTQGYVYTFYLSTCTIMEVQDTVI